MTTRQPGSLRRELLRIVSDRGPCSARDVFEAIRPDRDISFNTVATVLNRLVEQNILVRHGRPRRYTYALDPADETLRQRILKSVKDLLAESGGDRGLAHFVEAVSEIRPDAIDTLEQLLAARRHPKEADHGD